MFSKTGGIWLRTCLANVAEKPIKLFNKSAATHLDAFAASQYSLEQTLQVVVADSPSYHSEQDETTITWLMERLKKQFKVNGITLFFGHGEESQSSAKLNYV